MVAVVDRKSSEVGPELETINSHALPYLVNRMVYACESNQWHRILALTPALTWNSPRGI